MAELRKEAIETRAAEIRRWIWGLEGIEKYDWQLYLSDEYLGWVFRGESHSATVMEDRDTPYVDCRFNHLLVDSPTTMLTEEMVFAAWHQIKTQLAEAVC